MPDYRAVIALDISAENKAVAIQLAKQIATNAKGKKHATLPSNKVYGTDLIEVRDR